MTYGTQPPHGDPQGRPDQQPPWPQSWQQGPPPGWQGQWPPAPPAPPRRRLWPWVVAGVVLLLIVIGVANADPAQPTGRAALPVGTIEMPNYVGVNARAATDELRNTLGAGLSVMATGGDASSGYAVAAQSPAPGTPINLSSQILFYTAAPPVGSSGTSTTTPAAPAAPAAPTADPPPLGIVYEITGSGRASNITYSSNGTGGVSQQTSARLPWRQKIDSEIGDGYFYYLSAQNGPSGGTLTCRITRNGVVVGENESQGPYAVVSCTS